ncbi:hypothetical protein E3983_03255 [Legionella israelensis]|uniref:Uncharacterized protein n=1 Tax=Legionella israelensis TaxID=454 RepID=A0AAX1EEC8_9GAMM|nr:hypothetical protein [Legionella israelensis]QBR83466.1 hypothetical protein E3983_03255 [Legionella israelensis]
MPILTPRQKRIIEAIKQNHKRLLETRMVANLDHNDIEPEKISAWMNEIGEVRKLQNEYLSHITDLPDLSQKVGDGALAALAGGGLGSFFFLGSNLASSGITGSIKNMLGFGSGDPASIAKETVIGSFSVALAGLTTYVLYKAFEDSEKGDKGKTFEEFKEQIEKEEDLSKQIKNKSLELSKEVIKLFHFREMLLLGKITDNPLEGDARAEFIRRANLEKENKKAIDAAIEAYFLQELSRLFNQSFKDLYDVHTKDIEEEEASFFKKWFHQFFDSPKVRQNYSQKIQLEFMSLCREYLIQEMNEPRFFAKYPKITATMGGILVGALVLGTLALALGGPITWGIAAIALVSFAVAAVATYLLVTKVDKIHYKRSKSNREAIQEAVDKIDDEFLRLQEEIVERKETSESDIKQSKDFEKIDEGFLGFGEKMIAKGASDSWLREYAARYRHSKAIEIDLGDTFKKLVTESDTQTKQLISEIRQENVESLKKFIKDTQEYLLAEEHQDTIQAFGLIEKIKEQVILIAASVKVTPAELLAFYKLPINEGGLGGFEADLGMVQKLTPKVDHQKQESHENPYAELCDAAQEIYSNAPFSKIEKWFRGDARLLNMLGIPSENEGLDLTSDNIDEYLNNSYEILYSLNPRIKPSSKGIDPLEQHAGLSSEFVFYRMVLLAQLAKLCDKTNHQVTSNVQYKIKAFVKERFHIEPELFFEEMNNQLLMLEEPDENALFYYHKGKKIYCTHLDNVTQMLHLDAAYNTVHVKPRNILDFYIQGYLKGKEKGVFAYKKAETDLNPQGSEYYLNTVQKYIENTKGFMSLYQNHLPLLSSGILKCYKFSLSKQVYQTMLRIMLELDKVVQHEEHQNEADYLKKAFMELYSFSKNHCYPLHDESDAMNLIETAKNQLESEDYEVKIEADLIYELIPNLSSKIHVEKNEVSKVSIFPRIEKNDRKGKDKDLGSSHGSSSQYG